MARSVIHDLSERDPQVVELIDEADDAAEATRQCLRIGARAARIANVSVDTEVVERRFSEMESRLTTKVDEAVGEITDAAEQLLGDDGGALTVTLESHKEQLEELLGETFDPNSKTSVISILETVLAEAHEQHTKAVQRLVSADW